MRTAPVQHRRGSGKAIKRSFSLPSHVMAFADSRAATGHDGNLSRYICALVKQDMAPNGKASK